MVPKTIATEQDAFRQQLREEQVSPDQIEARSLALAKQSVAQEREEVFKSAVRAGLVERFEPWVHWCAKASARRRYDEENTDGLDQEYEAVKSAFLSNPQSWDVAWTAHLSRLRLSAPKVR